MSMQASWVFSLALALVVLQGDCVAEQSRNSLTASSPLVPGAVMSHTEFEGFDGSLHLHPGEGFHPCLVLRSDTDELHGLFKPTDGRWTVGVVVITKGTISPISGVGIGHTLADLKKAAPDGNVMRVTSELTDPVVFRCTIGNRTVDATVEWESSFRRQGSDWNTFDPLKIDESVRVLSLAWY